MWVRVGFYLLLNILKKEFGWKILDCTETMVSFVLHISLDLSWKKSKRTYVKFLKIESLNITIETNFDITEYLDVTFTLKTGKYYLYRNKIIVYYNIVIHKQSKHLPSIVKRIPSIISKQLSDISSDKEYSDKAAPIYNDALKNSDFSPTVHTRRHTGRNSIWFNLPFSSNVKM